METFINVDEIKIYDQTIICQLNTRELNKVMSKNTRGIARIEIEKIIQTKGNMTPMSHRRCSFN